jgi:DNA primase large subunit
MDDVATLAARYPFSKWGLEVIRGKLGDDSLDYLSLDDDTIEAVVRQFRLSLSPRRISREAVNYLYPEKEVLSYLFAFNFLVHSEYSEAFRSYLGKRYFNWLCERTYTFLEREREDLILKLFQEELHIPCQISGKYIVVNLTDYLGLHDRTVKVRLVSLPLTRGKLMLAKKEAARVASEVVFSKLTSLLDDKIKLSRRATKVPEFIEILQPIFQKNFGKITEIRERSYPNDPKKYPPCIRSYIERLEKGEPITHFGGFMLASFLRQIGSSKDEVLALFTKASNFDTEKSGYQTSHVFGELGSHTQYTAPACDTIKLSQLCPVEEYCDERIRHPVSVYRRNWRRVATNAETTG